MDEDDRPHHVFIDHSERDRHLLRGVEERLHCLDLVVVETVAVVVPAHHADDVEVEDLLGNVLFVVEELDGLEAVDPLLHDSSAAVSPLVLLSMYDFGALVGLFENLGN